MNIFLVKVFRKINAFKFFNFTLPIRTGAKTFKIPIQDNIGYSNLNTSEPWMIDVLKIVLPLGNKSFIDVGINIGQTLLKLRSISTNIAYVGFEPNPHCVNYVYKLIEKNGFKNTMVIPVGISDKTDIGVLNFIGNSKDDSAASMIAEFRKDIIPKRKAYIPLFKFEEVKESLNLGDVSILKIDVEGAEMEVINSFKNELEKNETILILEVLPVYNEKNTFRIERQNKIQNLLFDLNYSIFKVIKEKNLLADIQEIKEIGIHSDLNLCDYIVVPKTKVNDFVNQSKKVLGN